MVEVAEKKWYVIRAVTGQEVKIKDYILTEVTRVGLDKQIEEMLVPTEKVVQIRKGKKVSKEKTYFPGYIMMKADISGEILHVIKSVTNVLGFLGETKGGEHEGHWRLLHNSSRPKNQVTLDASNIKFISS